MAEKKHKKIVIIEDEVAISQMYKVKFELSGYDVTVAENGRLGLEAIQKVNPDIVLMDLLMPEMTGYETLKALRAIPEYRDLSVIMLTNVEREESVKKLEGLNVLRYIVKADVSPRQIVTIVTEELN